MKDWSLKGKLLFQGIMVCVLLGGIAAFGMHLMTQVASEYKSVSINQFPKADSAQAMVAKFRFIRIKVRSLAVTGNSPENQLEYIEATKLAIGDFLAEKKKFEALSFNDEEKRVVEKLDKEWGAFLAFGTELLAQYTNPTPESLKKGAYMIRDICPIKAKAWMSLAEGFVKDQRLSVKELVAKAVSKQATTVMTVNLLILFSSIIFVILGWLMAKKISSNIEKLVSDLKSGSEAVFSSSKEMLLNSKKLSDSSTEASGSLQLTVSSIDEISSMIQRNADAAANSTKVSNKSNSAAESGKKTVGQMIESINDISKSNEEIAKEMQRNNVDISKIIQVISEIGEKTKVINDIVFQTKLLSFNASVEAARAGEHGKGFAVVAEEVGNLASMSGKAALEITEMLDSSIKQVTDIVENTKKNVEVLVSKSKQKVDVGTKTAHECGEALDEILVNVSSVNELVREIATASSEQSTGVKEVTKAMQQLDQITHQNSSIAQNSSSMSSKLSGEADQLSIAIKDLQKVVSGKKGLVSGQKEKSGSSHELNENVISMPQRKEIVKTPSANSFKATGSDSAVPDENDSRFEDL